MNRMKHIWPFSRNKIKLSKDERAFLEFLNYADEWMRNDPDIKELRFVRIPKEDQEEGGAISCLNIPRYSHKD